MALTHDLLLFVAACAVRSNVVSDGGIIWIHPCPMSMFDTSNSFLLKPRVSRSFLPLQRVDIGARSGAPRTSTTI